MKILNIHGYTGSAENSACSVLRKLGYEVISPQLDYDSMLPEDILDTLGRQITENNIGCIVGTSLGGFFGAVLSARLSVPVILVNPCLMPFVTLPRLNFEGNIRPYIILFSEIANMDISGTSTIIGGRDDVIDYHDFTENLLRNKDFRIVPDGIHSGATLPLEQYFKEVLR
ncbi:MAG: hypothetical protein NC177_03770 [Ruminococcus flavefaciens]|nr:hypothetical protein [Ruminococcus flavefaciens]